MKGKAVFDIGLQASDDVVITTSGDFLLAESTPQHQKALLLTAKGEWRQNPQVGIDAESFVDDEGSANLLREITKAFMADGMEVDSLQPNPNSATDASVKVFEQAYYL